MAGDMDGCGWMSGLPDSTLLAHVSMPGTHNSASYSMKPGNLRSVVSASRCQSMCIESQLQMGVRFLDLRVRAGGNLCHGRVTCTSTLQDALSVTGAFLRAYPREVVLVRIKDEAAGKNTAGAIAALVQQLAESAEYPLYLQMRLPALGEVRGRIVLLCDWAGGLLGLQWGCANMLIQDQYWQKSGIKKWQVVKYHLQEAAPTPDLLQVHFTSATYLPRKTPITMARSVNPKLSEFLRSTVCACFYGVIAMDFPSASLCAAIIRQNWTSLDPCRGVDRLSACDAFAKEYLDNLQCELMAAATRADAASLHCSEELPAQVQRLAYVYLRLTVERASVELLEPAVCDRSAEETVSNDSVKTPSPTRGLFRRLGSRCWQPRKCRLPDVDPICTLDHTGGFVESKTTSGDCDNESALSRGSGSSEEDISAPLSPSSDVECPQEIS